MNPTPTTSHSSSKAKTPPFDPLKPSVPVSYPLNFLDELESRTYFDSFHFPFNISSVALQNMSLDDRPRMLVCHDMAGGYTDDKWVQGGSNPDAYAIWHWHLIDVFVYFSHQLVTLPPPCWTNTAHKHGVKVLGTFIMEGDGGRVVANKLIETKESAHMYAERLAELASALGFDGWLLNVEVRLDKKQIPNLKEFVSHLTETMHAFVPGSLVIWYDSVTVDGYLSYQNQLNSSNKPFFDISDGIFVNYFWQKNNPQRSADVARDRKFDVYMGIDVFGRGTNSGGGWRTNEALEVIKSANVSAAIFAPGWVYEKKEGPDFETAQNRWWSLVENSWGIMKNSLVLPFYSNFDQGHGQHVAIDGVQVSSAPWNNISAQTIQPSLKFFGDPSPNLIEAVVDFKEASYSGGGNITFKGPLPGDEYLSAKLFQGELLLGDSESYLAYSVKSDRNTFIGLSLNFKEKLSVLLASRGNTHLTMTQFSSKFNRVIMPCQVTTSITRPEWEILEYYFEMNGYTLTEIAAVWYKSNFGLGKLRIDSQIDGNVNNYLPPHSNQYSAILGHMTMKTPAQDLVFPPPKKWLIGVEDIEWTSGSQGSKNLSVNVVWRLKYGDASLYPNYNVFVQKLANQDCGKPEYLGVAHVQAFYVADLVVPSGISDIKFIIQVCGIDGTSQKVDDSPSFQLPVGGS